MWQLAKDQTQPELFTGPPPFILKQRLNKYLHTKAFCCWFNRQVQSDGCLAEQIGQWEVGSNKPWFARRMSHHYLYLSKNHTSAHTKGHPLSAEDLLSCLVAFQTRLTNHGFFRIGYRADTSRVNHTFEPPPHTVLAELAYHIMKGWKQDSCATTS